MDIHIIDGVMSVAQVGDITAARTAEFKEKLIAEFPHGVKSVIIDLKGTRRVDNDGLAILFVIFIAAVQKNKDTAFRILHPAPAVTRLLKLSQLHHLYEIGRR